MAQAAAVLIVDELPGTGRREVFRLELWSERVTARELIERRVRHEVDEYNLQRPEVFRGLVEPSEAEQTLNGWKLKRGRRIDADDQVAHACAAFEQGRVLLLVDDKQIDGIDEPFALRRDAEVCFYKLVPLVGG
jgi:hypothetical protein